jgi:hypothetical protein
MNVEFKEWMWSQYHGRQYSGLSLTLHGAVNFEPVCVGFGVTGLSELFGVQHDEKKLREAVETNREFLEKIARAWIRAGRLDDDRFLHLTKEDLRPFFQRRAATAPV